MSGNVDATKFLESNFGKLTFGEALKADRKSAELSQAQLAEAIGVSKQAISGFENGKDFPTYETIKKIAKVFKMDEETYVRLLLQDIANKKGFDQYLVEVTRVSKSKGRAKKKAS
ncbi:MAG TPA: helix-turn-helix transcriptional regulator [Oligoflexus sp.]|uniref:helix-turn-helix transcriptional regulator n=1 Tax=Oligoflexus sp. TaxID=1971216 RepID=UPI002D5AACF2|nr:helix-turn-helix transcriptional regulator [Oligoflexus sp.]HYX34238.1 helix-turn-helix transcriptional regulator [Oligoflexus sp.]